MKEGEGRLVGGLRMGWLTRKNWREGSLLGAGWLLVWGENFSPGPP